MCDYVYILNRDDPSNNAGSLLREIKKIPAIHVTPPVGIVLHAAVVLEATIKIHILINSVGWRKYPMVTLW